LFFKISDILLSLPPSVVTVDHQRTAMVHSKKLQGISTHLEQFAVLLKNRFHSSELWHSGLKM